MFSDQELEFIQELLNEHGERFVQTYREAGMLSDILDKIDDQLNG